MVIIEAIRAFLCTCPYLKDGKMNLDYLGAKPTEYTVDSVPSSAMIKQYVDGSSIRQCLFVFASTEYYGADVRTQIENAGFYSKVESWLNEQTKAGNLPVLEGGKVAQSIEALTGGYLFSATEDTARYQIQCRLVYFQPAQN